MKPKPAAADVATIAERIRSTLEGGPYPGTHLKDVQHVCDRVFDLTYVSQRQSVSHIEMQAHIRREYGKIHERLNKCQNR